MFGRITPVVKNILIINVALWLLNLLFGGTINDIFAFYTIVSDKFQPYQLFTYMWLHSDVSFMHILFNMIGLLVFGPMLENLWGPKKFLIFYFVVGIGAGVFYGAVDYIEKAPAVEKAESFYANPDPDSYYRYIVKYFPRELGVEAREQVSDLYDRYSEDPDNPYLISQAKQYVEQIRSLYTESGMVGASGAIYGILMAFGMLFPNMQLMLIFPPIPIRAKYLVFALGVLAIYSEINRTDIGVAHLAHLGGMLIAFILLKIWKQDRNTYY